MGRMELWLSMVRNTMRTRGSLILTLCAGCVPGPKNQIIRVQDARGKPWPAGPMSTAELKPAEVLAEAGVPDATESTASA
jgi:large subunit ribosomal protein L3